MAGVVFVAVTGFVPWYWSDRLNFAVVRDLGQKLRASGIQIVRDEVLSVTDSVRMLAYRGGTGAFSDAEGGDFGCCSAADDNAQRLSSFASIRRYHWENLESNKRVLLSFSGTMAGSIVLLAKTDNDANIDGTNARNGGGNFQWTLSDATTNYTYHQYYSNVWQQGGYVEADTSMCGKAYTARTESNMSFALTSKEECDAAAVALGVVGNLTEIADSAKPSGCFRDVGDSGVYWNPGGDATLQQVARKALCRMPSWFPRKETFTPDCAHPWPCESGRFVATGSEEFNPSLYTAKTSPYNATQRSWWQGAVSLANKGEPGWSKVYKSKSTGQLVLPAVMPLYVGTTRIVRSVICIGIGLLYLDEFIMQTARTIDTEAKGWIIDASSGEVLASSHEGLSTANPGLKAINAGAADTAFGVYIEKMSQELLNRLQPHRWQDFKSAHPSGLSFDYKHEDGSTDVVEVASVSDHYGLDWVIILTVPRSVFYSGLDAARLTTLIATSALTVAMGVLLLAISWVVSSQIKKLGVKMSRVSQMDLDASTEYDSGRISMYSEICSMQTSFAQMTHRLQSFRNRELEEMRRQVQGRHRRQRTRIRAAVHNQEELRHPMVLMEATHFIDLGKLMRYEDLRDMGKLRILDTMAKVDDFERDHVIIFFSHQWLDWGRPDPDNVHHECMTNAIRQMQQKMQNPKGSGDLLLSDMYVWVDYSSISQEHRGMQMLAVSALPVYSSKAHAFVVIAPPATHAASGERCDLKSYDKRGWCRVETLSKVCGSGLDRMFLMTGVDSPLEQVTMQRFRDDLSLRVFEGNFSCCALGHKGQPYCDKEKLVDSILGLYYVLLTQWEEDGSRHLVREHIQESKDRFFPYSFKFSRHTSSEEDEERELFGELVTLVESVVRGEIPLAASNEALRSTQTFESV